MGNYTRVTITFPEEVRKEEVSLVLQFVTTGHRETIERGCRKPEGTGQTTTPGGLCLWCIGGQTWSRG